MCYVVVSCAGAGDYRTLFFTLALDIVLSRDRWYVVGVVGVLFFVVQI